MSSQDTEDEKQALLYRLSPAAPSAARWAPVPATERFIRRTTGSGPSVAAVNIKETSKSANAMLAAGARLGQMAVIVEAQRHLAVRDMLDGIGGTLPAIAAMRFALGSFFVLSGFHKLTNSERHKTFVETLRVLHIPQIGILQWFVPGVEFFGGLGVAVGFLTPLAALGLLVICAVALFTNSPTVVASYKPIDRADRVDDWLYQPEVMYALMLLYFIAAGAGPVSVDQLLKLWIG